MQRELNFLRIKNERKKHFKNILLNNTTALWLFRDTYDQAVSIVLDFLFDYSIMR